MLSDTPLYITIPKLQYLTLQGFVTTLIWFFSIGSLLYFTIILLGRAPVLGKPDRLNVRDTPLRLPESLKSRYQGGSSFQSEGDTLLIEKNREDLVYGALRRLPSGWSQRLSLDNPLAGTLTCIFMSVAIVVLIIGLAGTAAASQVRDLTVGSVQQAAIRSQLESIYDDTYMCSDSRFKPAFENNIYARLENFNFIDDASQFFVWKFKENIGSLQDCTGIMAYASTFASLED